MEISSGKINPTYYLASFLLGLSTMCLEIAAARLLAPYFGTSALVWTNVIAVVLLSLSAGYFLGGKLAEKYPNPKFLFYIFTVASFLAFGIAIAGPNLLQILEDALLKTGLTYILTGSLLGSLLLFGFPLLLAGMASPFLVTLGIGQGQTISKTVGSFYAISTMGGLAGTFLPTLLLIPTIGTVRTIGLCALLLFISGLLVYLPASKKQGNLSLLILCLLTTTSVMLYPTPTKTRTLQTIVDTESTYQHITIQQEADGTKKLKFDSGLGVQSIYHPSKLLSGYYYDAYSLFPALIQKEKVRVLILGLAGGTIARQLRYFYADKLLITGIELDPKVLEVAKEHFGLLDLEVHVKVEDARLAVKNSHDQYDLIIVDTYRNELEIPWQMTTREFWQATKNILAPQGIVLMNVAHFQKKSFLVDSIANTLTVSFKYVAVGTPNLTSYNNSIVIASENEPKLTQHATPVELSENLLALNNTLSVREHNKNLPVLTDDKASMEWLMMRDLRF